MRTLEQLRAARLKAVKAAQAITEAAANDGDRPLSDDEGVRLDGLLEEIDGLDVEIDRRNRLDRAVERLEAAEPRAAGGLETLEIPTAGGEAGFVLPTATRAPRNLVAFDGGPNPLEGGQADAYAVGQWIRAKLYGQVDAMQWVDRHGDRFGDLKAAMGGATNSQAGGVLVPSILENRVIRLVEERGVFRRNAFRWPMSSDHSIVPRRKSGLTAYAVGENTTITASDVKFSAVELVARKWATLTLFSSELSEDAIIAVADIIVTEIAYAFADKEDLSGFVGDGTSTYHGIHGVAVRINDGNHAASIATAASGNVSFETLDLADYEAAVGKLPQYAERGAKWYISKYGWAVSMQRLQDAAGGNTARDIGAGAPREFLGYPVEIVQVMNSTAGSDVSAIKALLGDLRLSSTFGDRRGMRIKTSSERYIELDQEAIQATTRFDINNHDLGDGSTAGPMIAVKTAAS